MRVKPAKAEEEEESRRGGNDDGVLATNAHGERVTSWVKHHVTFFGEKGREVQGQPWR